MKVETYFAAGSVDADLTPEHTAVVLDVVRATTTIVTALARGARAVYPVTSSEEAVKLASSLGREDVLLGGEREGLRMEGFDLGNSPAEYAEEVVAGKQIVMTTTNGTRAFLAVEDARRIFAGSFLNLSAVAEAVAGADRLAVVCAGREDRFSLDDAVCAGRLLLEVAAATEGEPDLDDAGAASVRLAAAFDPDEAFLRRTRAGRALVEIGLDGDLSLCVDRDRYDIVPEMRDRMIRLPQPAPAGEEDG